MLALNQHHLINRGQNATIDLITGGRIRHGLKIGQSTTTGSSDFVKNSTLFGILILLK